MQVKITHINRSNKTSKAGKPYESVGIRCVEYGERWINGFGRADNKSWKVGDTVDVNVVEKGAYLNFEMPERAKSSGFTLEDRQRLEKIEAMVSRILALSETPPLPENF